MTEVRVDHLALLQFATDVFSAAGMNAFDAASVADILVWANERGIDSHGVSRMPIYLNEIARGELKVQETPSFRQLLPATFVLECKRTAGPACMMKAINRATEIADRFGVGVGLLSEPSHLGAIGRYAELIAQRGYAGIVLVAGLPFMAYHGAKVRSLGTSPIAIGIPGSGTAPDDQPLLLDMATSITAAGRIAQAAAKGQEITEGIAIDASGNPTTDPRKATTMLPLGGPKGSGLALMFECLTGILAGTPILSAFANDPDRAKVPLQNSMVIVFNIGGFRSPPDYRRDIQLLKTTIKQLPRQDAFSELLLPGERGGREARSRQQRGIPLPSELWTELGNIAKSLGVKQPQLLL
jgi:ureidoglycolate dehydrogenase (NAD+)